MRVRRLVPWKRDSLHKSRSAAPGQQNDAAQLLNAWPPVTTSPPAILVVQDEPSDLHIASVFCAAGYEVTAVVGAAKAMSVLQGRGPFALYVIDLPIPSERGAVLAGAIRQSQPDARILYVTAFSDALLALHGRLMPGREELLEKPSSDRRCLHAASRMLFGHDKGPHAKA